MLTLRKLTSRVENNTGRECTALFADWRTDQRLHYLIFINDSGGQNEKIIKSFTYAFCRCKSVFRMQYRRQS